MKLFHIGLSAAETPENGLQKAFREVFPEYREINCGHKDLNNEVIRIAEEFRPDIVWMQIQCEGILHVGTARKLKELGCFVMNWTGDVRATVPPWMIEMGPHIDLTLFSNYTDVLDCRKRGIKSGFLQIGIDPEIYNRNGPVSTTQDIVFMGNNYGQGQFPLSSFRAQMVHTLKSRFKDRFGLYGTGWNSPRANGNYLGNQRGEAAIYRGCKIAINCSHFDYSRYSSDRLFRAMASGAFVLTKWYPNIEADFIDREHLVVWHNMADLVQKCEYYLRQEEERKEIAAEGCRLAHNRDTFKNMCENIKQLYLTYKQ